MKKFFSSIDYNSPFILSYFFVSLVVVILSTFISQNILVFFSIGNVSFFSPISFLTLFTHVIGHANFEHFLGNFLIILLVGPILEEKYGSLTLLVLTALTALSTGIFQIIFFSNGLLGASGVAFMLILLASFVNLKNGRIPLTLILVALIYLGQELLGIFTSDNISQSAHLIGGIVGIAGGIYLNKSRRIPV